MNTEFFTRLRLANQARQAEWDPSGFANNVDWRVNELGGELGEALNVMKKLHRERCGVPGSRATVEQLAEELADVVICADLLAAQQGHPALVIEEADKDDPYYPGLIGAGRAMLSLAGKLSPGDEDAIWLLASCAFGLARREGIDLFAAIVAKFNATSDKVGLTTKF